MYQDTFEDDDLIAEVELVTQETFTQNNDMDDGFDAEGNLVSACLSLVTKRTNFFFNTSQRTWIYSSTLCCSNPWWRP